MELKEGTIVAERYRLDRELGSGGAGVVWAATHRVTGRRVALKLIAAPAHRRGAVRRRTALEARAAASLDHPNVVDVLDVFPLDEATTVLVMERLEGQTLRELLDEVGVLEVDRAARLLLPAVCAVGAAHAAGVAHRDLKPENLFVVRSRAGDETTKVLDFGIAKLLDGEDDGVTRTGTVIGTPAYMAPEQGEGSSDLDHRVDVWAFGVILYEAFSGGRPVEGRSFGEIRRRMQEDGIPPLAVVAPDVPEPLAALVDAMLARAPEERTADLRSVADVLARYTDVPLIPFEAPGEGAPLTRPDDHDESSDAVARSSRGAGEPTLEEEGVRVREAAAPSPTPGPTRSLRWAVLAAVAALGVLGLVFGRAAGTEPAAAGDGDETPIHDAAASPPSAAASERPVAPEPAPEPAAPQTATSAAPPPPPRSRPTKPVAPPPEPTASATAATATGAPPPAAPPSARPSAGPSAGPPAGTPGLVEEPPF